MLTFAAPFNKSTEFSYSFWHCNPDVDILLQPLGQDVRMRLHEKKRNPRFSDLLRVMWISDLEAESKEVLCWPKSSFSVSPWTKFLSNPVYLCPSEKLSKSLEVLVGILLCGISGDDLNLAFSVKGERENLELMSSLMIRVWMRWRR